MHSLSTILQEALDQELQFINSSMSTTYKNVVITHINYDNSWHSLHNGLIKAENDRIFIERRYFLSLKLFHSVKKYPYKVSSVPKSSIFYGPNFQYSTYSISSSISNDSLMETDRYYNNPFGCSRPTTLEEFLERNISSTNS